MLGRAIQGGDLRRLLIDAVRYGDRPDVRAKLYEKVDQSLDHDHLRRLLEDKALAHDTMDISKVQEIRGDMERAAARRLQPRYISQFFREAFSRLGGQLLERETDRYEITRVPAAARARDRQIGVGAPVLPRYERITFEKSLLNVPGKPIADLLCPGHPLLDATIDIVLEEHRTLLKRGALLVDRNDQTEEPRIMVMLEHAIHDDRRSPDGIKHVISRQMQFIEIGTDGNACLAGYAPYLDLEPATDEEKNLAQSTLEQHWREVDVESFAVSHASEHFVPRHFEEVRSRREDHINKTFAAVKDRLTKEINYWDARAADLKRQQEAGRQPKMNWPKAQARADELQVRLKNRLAELEKERRISKGVPHVIGGALVVPQGLLDRLAGKREGRDASLFARETSRIEQLAMKAVMEVERLLDHTPRDVSADKLGYDIESRDGETGLLRFIEVKGRVKGADTITVTTNEINTALNRPDEYILALVEVDDNDRTFTRYVHQPFQREPDFGVTSVNYSLRRLANRAVDPMAGREADS